MKKFLKVFIIVILVLGVIAGTTFFFFRNLKEKNNTTSSIAAMLQSESKLKFNEGLDTLNGIANDDKSDERMELLIKTNKNLDEIIFVLATYYIDTDTKINNEAIAEKFKDVNSSRDLLIKMIDEYTIKEENAENYFNEHSGLNDFYDQCCDYLVQYATLANLLNESLNVNKSADFKFNMFNVYSNVVINTFNETELIIHNANEEGEHKRVIVKNSSNIDVINGMFKIRNSYIVIVKNEGLANEEVVVLNSSNVNKFNEWYNKCDKTTFAKEFDNNIKNASKTGPKEVVSAYYLKLIYGI